MSTNFKWLNIDQGNYNSNEKKKVSQACLSCRTKKLRCTGDDPCKRCRESQTSCRYEETKARSNSIGNGRASIAPSPVETVFSDDDTKIALNNIAESFNVSNLRHIRFFSSSLYQRVVDTTRKTHPHIYNQVPPLLYDFFNITAQPISVWSKFLNYFIGYKNTGITMNTDSMANQLPRETLRLFRIFNPLYRTMMKMPKEELLVHLFSTHLDGSPPSSNLSIEDQLEVCLLRAIFSVMFQSACQSASQVGRNIEPELQIYASRFYRDARHEFLGLTFPDEAWPQNRSHLIRLTQIAVMLTHFQCMTLREEQAYMTCMLGLGFAQRYLSDDSLSNEKVALFRVVEGWAVWLSFYLRRLNVLPKLSIRQKSKFRGVNAQATWAVRVLKQHTRFLHSLINANNAEKFISMGDIKKGLASLRVDEGRANTDSYNGYHDSDCQDGNDNVDSEGTLIGADEMESLAMRKYVLRLYHNILTIQLFECQLVRPLTSFDGQFKNGLHQQRDYSCPCMAEQWNCGHKIAFDACVAAANDIAQAIFDIESIMKASTKTCPNFSLILYALCITLSILSIRQPGSNDDGKRSKLGSSFDQTSNSALATVMRLEQTSRTLNMDRIVMNPIFDYINWTIQAQNSFVDDYLRNPLPISAEYQQIASYGMRSKVDEEQLDQLRITNRPENNARPATSRSRRDGATTESARKQAIERKKFSRETEDLLPRVALQQSHRKERSQTPPQLRQELQQPPPQALQTTHIPQDSYSDTVNTVNTYFEQMPFNSSSPRRVNSYPSRFDGIPHQATYSNVQNLSNQAPLYSTIVQHGLPTSRTNMNMISRQYIGQLPSSSPYPLGDNVTISSMISSPPRLDNNGSERFQPPLQETLNQRNSENDFDSIISSNNLNYSNASSITHNSVTPLPSASWQYSQPQMQLQTQTLAREQTQPQPQQQLQSQPQLHSSPQIQSQPQSLPYNMNINTSQQSLRSCAESTSQPLDGDSLEALFLDAQWSL